ARRVLDAGASYGLRAKFHADEFVTLGGAELAAELHALSADHLLKARVEDVAKMKEAGVTAALLPGTAFFLGLPYPPARKLLKRGKVVHPSGERRSDMPNAAESRLVSGQARSVPAPRPPLP